MLIKEKDGIKPQLEELQRLLGAAKISAAQRDQIQDEIKRLKAGAQGEENAAYHTSNCGTLKITPSSTIYAWNTKAESPKSTT